MSDVLLDHHPIMIAKLIRDRIGDRTQKEVARDLGITAAYLNDILQARRCISPTVAARLHKIGLDGRMIYLAQEGRRFEIASRNEAGNDLHGRTP